MKRPTGAIPPCSSNFGGIVPVEMLASTGEKSYPLGKGLSRISQQTYILIIFVGVSPVLRRTGRNCQFYTPHLVECWSKAKTNALLSAINVSSNKEAWRLLVSQRVMVNIEITPVAIAVITN